MSNRSPVEVITAELPDPRPDHVLSGPVRYSMGIEEVVNDGVSKYLVYQKDAAAVDDSLSNYATIISPPVEKSSLTSAREFAREQLLRQMREVAGFSEDKLSIRTEIENDHPTAA